ncbi:MAG: type 1 glutamine amidotransferase [Candidatus Omnitrophica bacterium]|nr:type 1 glutamine amidotransferase [Candidatus Omnitrophota bacterium]
MTMKPVLYIQPIGCEGPGLIESTRPEFVPTVMCRPAIGHAIPPNPIDYSAIVCLGGPMGVYETDKHPWIEDLISLVRESIHKRVPFLGICFGSQILAAAAGAKVEPTGIKEIGWEKIHLTEEGREDPLLAGFPQEIEVFHWHGDRWELPEGATLLASSEKCDHQIFRLGAKHFGFQCHLEVMAEDPPCWAEAYLDELNSSENVPTPEQIGIKTTEFHPKLTSQAKTVFDAFWDLAVR